MARIYLFSSSSPRVLYSVDDSVGQWCANRRDDVLLVQFFLKVIFESLPNAFPKNRLDALICDGRWGQISQAYLERYIASSVSVKDGRVDPIKDGRFRGSRSGAGYTIIGLQFDYVGARGASALDDITTDPFFPAPLRPSLKLAG